MIDTISYLNTGITTPYNVAEPATASSGPGKEAFMQLLLTQLTHQNPLDPMDNTQFVSQLAQFSALEIQQNMAAAMELLALTQGASTNVQMVGLIGKRVLVPGDEISLGAEGAASIRFRSDGGHSAELPARLVISDAQGQVVRTMTLSNISSGVNEVAFDGKDDNGNRLAPGLYSYKILDGNNNGITGLTTYSNYLVDAVAFEGNSIILKSGNRTVNMAEVNEVIAG